MNLPEQPPTFRPPTPAERPWWWRVRTADGEDLAGEQEPGQDEEARFVSRADAESWLGEGWRLLAERGAASATLHELERVVPPMVVIPDPGSD